MRRIASTAGSFAGLPRTGLRSFIGSGAGGAGAGLENLPGIGGAEKGNTDPLGRAQHQTAQQRLNEIGRTVPGARYRRQNPAPGDVVSSSAKEAAESMGINVNQQTESAEGDNNRNQVAPLIYTVPFQASRVVGRDRDQLALWQSLLSGRKVHLITGIDGMGKSSLTAEFADACRRSGRFSCIQWFNAEDPELLAATLKLFFADVKGRMEREVMLIFDNVTDFAAIDKLLPTHDYFYAVMTSSTADIPKLVENGFMAKHKVNLFPCPPLDWKFTAQLLELEVLEEDMIERLCALLGNVPLLANVTRALLGSGEVLTADELAQKLEEVHSVDGMISVSRTLKFLIQLALDKMEKEPSPGAVQWLRTLALLNIKDLSPMVTETLLAPPTGTSEEGNATADDLAALVVSLGLMEPKWDSAEGGWTIHPSIAKLMREQCSEAVRQETVAYAANALLEKWPKRMRGMGQSIAIMLVSHIAALQASAPTTTDPAALSAFRKAAAFLANTECRDLPMAARLLTTVYDARATLDAEEAVVVAKDLGLLLLRLRRPEAETVLRTALQIANKVHGENSIESASVVASLSGFLPVTRDSRDLLQEAASTIQHRALGTGSSELMLSDEEKEVHQRNLFGLSLRIAQITEALGETVPSSLWDKLENLHRTIMKNQRQQQQ